MWELIIWTKLWNERTQRSQFSLTLWLYDFSVSKWAFYPAHKSVSTSSGKPLFSSLCKLWEWKFSGCNQCESTVKSVCRSGKLHQSPLQALTTAERHRLVSNWKPRSRARERSMALVEERPLERRKGNEKPGKPWHSRWKTKPRTKLQLFLGMRLCIHLKFCLNNFPLFFTDYFFLFFLAKKSTQNLQLLQKWKEAFINWLSQQDFFFLVKQRW